MKLEDAYKVLGLEQTASETEVKSAYKKLALKNHPDKNVGDSDAHGRFLEISEAYKRISDPTSCDDDIDGPSEEEMSEMFNDIFADIIPMMMRFGAPGKFNSKKKSSKNKIPSEMFEMMEQMLMEEMVMSMGVDDFALGSDDDDDDDDDAMLDLSEEDMEQMLLMEMMMGAAAGGMGGYDMESMFDGVRGSLECIK